MTLFVGLDIVPIQVNLPELHGRYENIRSRIQWVQSDLYVTQQCSKPSLESLPFEDSSFDYIHLSLLGLGIPESSWSHVLDECTRLLEVDGTIEIMEMDYTPPENMPIGSRNSFLSNLLADMVHPIPALPIKFALPITGLKWEEDYRVFEGEEGRILGRCLEGKIWSSLG
jgi:hypothetical protein